MKFIRLFFIAVALTSLTLLTYVVAAERSETVKAEPVVIPQVPPGAEVITLGAGCFWHTGTLVKAIPGVLAVTAGYTGGSTKNPTHEEVSSGKTGHSEVSRVIYDPKQITLDKILDVFWLEQSPPKLYPPQTRSVIYYNTEMQRQIAEASKAKVEKRFGKPVLTEIAAAREFFAAENYHQKMLSDSCSYSVSLDFGKAGITLPP